MAEKVGFEPACRMICGAKMRFNVRFYDAKAGICDHITCSFRAYGVIVGSKNRRYRQVHRRQIGWSSRIHPHIAGGYKRYCRGP